ncbi:MAG: DUF2513 domain-containing protein [Tistlia sp.]|uniref:DUF2513 domain-containing protein n=1 Tax=Tistlia sp. TaxID=3057121 RepID=UPI0034A46245
MKRDMDLCRQILFKLEEMDRPPRGTADFEGRFREAPAELYYQVYLLKDAGLIEAMDARSSSGDRWLPQKITWAGQEFLDAARSDTVWSKARARATEVGGTLAYQILKELCLQYAREQLGLQR